MFLNKNVLGPKGLQAGPAHLWKVNQVAKFFDWRWEDLCGVFVVLSVKLIQAVRPLVVSRMVQATWWVLQSDS